MICALEKYFIVLHATLSSAKNENKLGKKKRKAQTHFTQKKNSFNLAFLNYK